MAISDRRSYIIGKKKVATPTISLITGAFFILPIYLALTIIDMFVSTMINKV